VSSRTEAADQHVTNAAESAAARVREQAEAVHDSIASARPAGKPKRKARKAHKQAVKSGHHLSEEAAARGRKAAKKASEEARKRGEAALAAAPVVASKAGKKARKKGERALEVARDKGGEALLSALESDPGKRLTATPAGAALKAKLTARKRRRRRLLLITIAGAGGAIVFKQQRSGRHVPGTPAGGEGYDSRPVSVPPTSNTPPTETTPPASAGTAAGDSVAGKVEEAVAESSKVEGETEPPATTAGEDGELKARKTKSD
jgi:hypothetical protein